MSRRLAPKAPAASAQASAALRAEAVLVGAHYDHLGRGDEGSALDGRANGEFRDFDPARIANTPQLRGHMSGTVNAAFGVAKVSGPMTPDAITADGEVTIAKSDIAGFDVDSADVMGQYANRRGTLRQATIKDHG